MAQLAYQQALTLPNQMEKHRFARGEASACHAATTGMANRSGLAHGTGPANAAADGGRQPKPGVNGQHLKVVRRNKTSAPVAGTLDEEPIYRQSLRNLWAVKNSN